eukprot:9255318-Karenia_brevis.AAC.1
MHADPMVGSGGKLSRKARWRVKQRLKMKGAHVMEGPSSSSPRSPITVGIVGQPQGAKAVTL